MAASSVQFRLEIAMAYREQGRQAYRLDPEQATGPGPRSAAYGREDTSRTNWERFGSRYGDKTPRCHVEPCAFLRVGTVLEGCQRVEQGSRVESWRVRVTVREYDAANGTLAGTMEAFDAASDEGAPTGPAGWEDSDDAFESAARHVGTPAVVTWWDGEVLDGLRNQVVGPVQGRSVAARAGGDGAAASPASRAAPAPPAELPTDALGELTLWASFEPFAEVALEAARTGDLPAALAGSGTVFLRLQERFFVSSASALLTISGRYFACLDRVTGELVGIYHDHVGVPDQELRLVPARAEAGTGGGGYAAPARMLA